MSIKILGQTKGPGADATDVVYEVPAGKAAVISTIAVCNRSAAIVQYWIATVTSVERQNDPQHPETFGQPIIPDKAWIIYDAGLAANGTDYHTVGITLSTGSAVIVQCADTISINLYGEEINQT